MKKNISSLAVLLLVVMAVGAGCATQTDVAEAIKASEVRTDAKIKGVSDQAARNIGALNSALTTQFVDLRKQHDALKGQVSGLASQAVVLESAQKKASEEIVKVGKKADAANRAASGARKEAGVARVMHRYNGSYAALIYGFGVGKSDITEAMYRGIEKEIVELVLNKNLEVKAIIGYADVTGKADKNDEIASARAEATKKAIEEYDGMDLSLAKVEVEGASNDFGALGYNRAAVVIMGLK